LYGSILLRIGRTGRQGLSVSHFVLTGHDFLGSVFCVPLVRYRARLSHMPLCRLICGRAHRTRRTRSTRGELLLIRRFSRRKL